LWGVNSYGTGRAWTADGERFRRYTRTERRRGYECRRDQPHTTFRREKELDTTLVTTLGLVHRYLPVANRIKYRCNGYNDNP
jgi:hypothetical protein